MKHVTVESYLLSMLYVARDLTTVVESQLHDSELDTPLMREFVGTISQHFKCIEAWANSQFSKQPKQDTHESE